MKNFKIEFLLVLMTLMFLVQGCYTLNQVGYPTENAIEITNKENATSIQHFTHTKWVNHFLWGLVSPKDADVEQIISYEIYKYGGERAVNITMKYQQTFINGLLGVLTSGIYTPFTLTIEGDVVK